MTRTIVYFLIAVIALGTIATPGLGAFALVAIPLIGLGFIWRIALTVSTHGHPGNAVVHTRHSHLLGPGGPDDSFADYRDEDEYSTGASTRAAERDRASS
jgi:hypothetical protein